MIGVGYMKKKLIFVVLSIVCLLGLVYTANYVRADSGWDTDYDSDWGSDWDSDYDSDWGSDWDWGGSDYDYGNSYHSSYDGDTSVAVIFLIAFGIFAFLTIADYLGKHSSSYKRVDTSFEYKFKEVNASELEKYGINASEFCKMVYEKYVSIQEAWSNFDYDKLRGLLTDELYNSYVMQLETLKTNKQKNIMSDFECIETKITKVSDENGIINVVTYLRVQMFDYVVDSNDKVVRGSKDDKIDIQYIIKFVKTDESKIDTCPNCGAKIDFTTGGKCKYCRSNIVVDPGDYVMSSKTNVGQRRI